MQTGCAPDPPGIGDAGANRTREIVEERSLFFVLRGKGALERTHLVVQKRQIRQLFSKQNSKNKIFFHYLFTFWSKNVILNS